MLAQPANIDFSIAPLEVDDRSTPASPALVAWPEAAGAGGEARVPLVEADLVLREGD